MSSFTKKLIPSFLRDPAVALIGEGCYVSLVEELNLLDTGCLKYALSKGLGLGIVVGGSIMKLPQLLLIWSAKSARGLSLTSYIMETASYAINLMYSTRRNFPFSTYGENFFLTIQNVIITLLIVHYTPRSTPAAVAIAAGIVIASAYALFKVPESMLYMLQVSTVPLSLLSKLPQIMSNYRLQSTGRLSAFAVIAGVAGCMARLYTTVMEVRDPVVLWGFIGATILNVVIAAQMWMYWGFEETKSVSEKELETVPVPLVGRMEPELVSPSPNGRRWARKID